MDTTGRGQTYSCFAKNRSDPLGCASIDDELLTSSHLVSFGSDLTIREGLAAMNCGMGSDGASPSPGAAHHFCN
jgi:hypothetical protein